MGTLIILVVALGALGAFLVGAVLLYFYFRTGREEGYDEPLIYGDLVQCPACGTMNPTEAAACLNCRRPLPHMRATVPPAPYAQPAQSAQPPPAVRPANPAPNPPVANPAPQRPNPAPPQPNPSAVPAPLPPLNLSRERPADMPLAWLEGRAGAAVGHRDILRYADVLVGRSTACDVQIGDPKVSRRHFLVRYANGQFFLQDQQSSRGTKINGEHVMAQRLEDGDQIMFGDSTMIFRVDRSEASDSA